MTLEKREFYSSSNGDRWYLARDEDLEHVFIWHEPNVPSGGRATRIEIGAFFGGGGPPEQQELLRLIGTLVDVDRSEIETTRIRSHAKSHIVELTDGSKWRVWPGDLATTLGWTSEAEIEAVPIDDEFCSHALIDHSAGTRVRAIKAGNDWPVERVRESMRGG